MELSSGESGLSEWPLAIYKIIGPLALSAPTSQAFVKIIFFLSGLMTAG